MTNEEALKSLKDIKSEIEWGNPTEAKLPLTLALAIEALEKQIPKEPQAIKSRRYYYNCPQCNGVINSLIADYCPHCGQKLKWEEEEDEDDE